MTVEIRRIPKPDGDDRGTPGVLLLDGRFECFTLENPWLRNEPNVSCIPRGVYRLRRRQSPRFGDTYQVEDVPGRSHILFHGGNRERDTRGCILVARQLKWAPGGEPALIGSQKALRPLLRRLREGGKEHFVVFNGEEEV